MNVFDPCSKFPMYNLNIRQDIHVGKNKSEKIGFSIARLLRIESNQCGPVSFFSDYFHSF